MSGGEKKRMIDFLEKEKIIQNNRRKIKKESNYTIRKIVLNQFPILPLDVQKKICEIDPSELGKTVTLSWLTNIALISRRLDDWIETDYNLWWFLFRRDLLTDDEIEEFEDKRLFDIKSIMKKINKIIIDDLSKLDGEATFWKRFYEYRFRSKKLLLTK